MKGFFAAMAVLSLVAVLAVAAVVKTEGLMCPVAGKAVNASTATDYEGGKVYFCCNDCKSTFQANQAKYAAKAHHQLVASGQAKQATCPISGEPTVKTKSAKVGGAEVFFCCDTCKDKVSKASGDEQLDLVFSAAAWKKGGFKVAK